MNQPLTSPSLLRRIASGLTAAAMLLGLSVGCAASLGVSLWYALFTAVAAAILSVIAKGRLLVPEFLLMVPFAQLLHTGTNALFPVALVGGTVLYLLLERLFAERLSIPDYVRAGALLGLAFSVTALFTTDYFGIGATGGTVWEILGNYRSLGFHPNWRGIFYGTVALFAMITYPFKCRKWSKYLPAVFFSLALPLVLDYCLNTGVSPNAVNEIGTLSDMYHGFTLTTALPFLGVRKTLPVQDFLIAAKAAVSTALLLFASSCLRRKHSNTKSIGTANLFVGIGGGFPLTEIPADSYTALSAAVATAALSAVFLLCPSVLSRIPVHAAAVILIVAAWQRVPFGIVGKVVKRGVLPAFLTLLIFATFVLTDAFWALLLCGVLCVAGRKAEANEKR